MFTCEARGVKLYNRALFFFSDLCDRFPDAIDRGTAQVQLSIPPNFTSEVQAGRTGNLQVVIDGSDAINGRVTRLAIQGTTLSVVQAQISKIADSIGVIYQVRLWFNPGRQESLFTVPGSYGVILAIFPPLLIALAEGFGEAIALVREKEQGTILQLYASSLSASELLLGKSGSIYPRGIGRSFNSIHCWFFVVSSSLYWRSTPLIIGTPVFIWVSVQLGLIIGIFTTTQSVAVQAIGTIEVLTAFLLAGFLFPLNTVPFPFSIADVGSN